MTEAAICRSPVSRTTATSRRGSRDAAVKACVALEDIDLVDQPVALGAGDTPGAEDLAPFVEWKGAGDQRGAASVAL